MGDSAEGSRSRTRIQRLIGFSDAVVAIAATLLVVPLVEIVPNTEIANVPRLLADNTNNFVVFGITFVVVYRFWLSHHYSFGNADQLTGPLIWLNGVWLLSIAFLPFPTQLLGSVEVGNRLANALYIGTLLVTSVSGVAGHWLIVRGRRSRGAPDTWRETIPGLLIAGSLTVALLVALLVPQVGLWALLLLLAGGFVAGRLRGGRRHG